MHQPSIRRTRLRKFAPLCWFSSLQPPFAALPARLLLDLTGVSFDLAWSLWDGTQSCHLAVSIAFADLSLIMCVGLPACVQGFYHELELWPPVTLMELYARTAAAK